MPSFWLEIETNTDKLVMDIRASLAREDILEFILELDTQMADLDFTTELYARLGDVLREELESNAE